MSTQENKRIRRDLLILFLILVPALGTVWMGRRLERSNKLEQTLSLSQEELMQSISFSEDEGLLQQVHPFDQGDGYSIFLPSDMEQPKLFFHTFETLRIVGDRDYHYGDRLSADLVDGQSYEAWLMDVQGIAQGKTTVTFYHATDLPSLYVDTEGSTTEAIDQDKRLKIKAYYMAIEPDGTISAEGGCKFGTRGNSSLKKKQKPYSIKAKKAASPFGLEESQEWALSTNTHYDGMQLIRNKTCLDLCRRIGLEFAVDTRFCNLFIDGEYRGMYMLTEKATIDGGSVHLKDLQKEHKAQKGIYQEQDVVVNSHEDGSEESYRRSNVSALDITGGYVLQMSQRYKSIPNHFTSQLRKRGKGMVVKNPRTLSDEEMQYISDVVRTAENVLLDENSTDEELKQYFDYESWARFFLIQEFSVQWDMEFDSFKFNKRQGDPLLYAGPVWDMDLCFGTMFMAIYPKLAERTLWVKDGRYEGWLRRFDQYPQFRELVLKTYREVFSPAVTEYLENEYYETMNKTKSSMVMNDVRWRRSHTDYESYLDETYQWMKDRQAFLDDYLDHADEYVRVLFHFPKINMSYYVKRGEKLNYLPLSSYGEVELREYPDGYISGWVDEEGNPADPNVTVDQDLEFYVTYADEQQPDPRFEK